MIKRVTEKFYNSEKEKFQKENNTAIIADNILGCFLQKILHVYTAMMGLSSYLQIVFYMRN